MARSCDGGVGVCGGRKVVVRRGNFVFGACGEALNTVFMGPGGLLFFTKVIRLFQIQSPHHE